MFDRINPSPNENLQSILAHWWGPGQLAGLRHEEIPAGRSDSRFWRISDGDLQHCLRRSPLSHPVEIGNRKRIHSFMQHMWNAGFQEIPLPRQTLGNETLLETVGATWELMSWLSGEPPSAPTKAHALIAVVNLARFHDLAATYQGPLQGIPHGLKHRQETLEELSGGLLHEIQMAIRASPSPIGKLASSIARQLAMNLPIAQSMVDAALGLAPLQWCLLDCHIQNFLFVDDRFTGIVDFATAGIGSISQDIARLVGSVVKEDQTLWRDCLAAYQAHRRLSSDELRLILAFHVSGIVGAAANWLRWRFVENHPAADVVTTQDRLKVLAVQLSAIDQTKALFSGLIAENQQQRTLGGLNA